MKSKVLMGLLAAGLVVGGLSACGDKKDNGGTVVTPVPTAAPAPTTVAPTTQAPTAEPTSAGLQTPGYVNTDENNVKAFFAAIDNDPTWGPAAKNLTSADLLTLGVATCVVLNSNNGSLTQTISDVVDAGKGKITQTMAGFLIGAAQVTLCPTVTVAP